MIILADVDTTHRIVQQLRQFNEDLHRNGDAYDTKNYASKRQGASVQTFYGKEINQLTRDSNLNALLGFIGFRSSRVCHLLNTKLYPYKYLQFKGHHAGIVIRMVGPIAIHTIKYDHVLADLRDDRLIMAAPRKMNIYVNI